LFVVNFLSYEFLLLESCVSKLFMRGIVAEKILLFDPKIECTTIARCNRIIARKKKQERKTGSSIDKKEHISTMAKEQLVRRTLLDYSMPNINNYQWSIMRPLIQANNFEIKPALLQVI